MAAQYTHTLTDVYTSQCCLHVCWPLPLSVNMCYTVYMCAQWWFQGGQDTRAGDTCGTRRRLMGGEKSGPSPYLSPLVRGLCTIILQDNIVVSNKHNWPEFYPGNAWACPGLELPMCVHRSSYLLRGYKASHLTAFCAWESKSPSPGHPIAADEAWYWLKCSGWLGLNCREWWLVYMLCTCINPSGLIPNPTP